MTMILVSEIGYEPKYYPRVNGREDWLTVHRYRDTLAADPAKEFPPVHVVKVEGKKFQFGLLDGVHRTKAYHLAGRERIPAEIERLPISKWFARSVELNATHGRQFDTGDKAWVAVRLEEDGFTIGQAAALLQMRVESLEKIKVEHMVKIKANVAKNIPTGRSHRETGNRHYGFLKSAFKDHAQLGSATAVLEAQAPVNSRNVLNILDSFIAVLEAGLDSAESEVAERLAVIRKLLR